MVSLAEVFTREAMDVLFASYAYRVDYYYSNDGDECTYLERDNEGTWVPSCLFGHVLSDLGMPVDFILKWEMKSINMVLAGCGVKDARLITAVWCAQLVQDTEKLTWGDAIQAYYEILRLGTADGDLRSLVSD
jgi:hypothetical protein